MSEKEKPPARSEWGAGRAAFFAQLDKVRELVAARWPTAQIYRELRESLGGMAYNTFWGHVRTHIGPLSGGTMGGVQGSGVRVPPTPTKGTVIGQAGRVPRPGIAHAKRAGARPGQEHPEAGCPADEREARIRRVDLGTTRVTEYRAELDPDPTIDAEKKRNKYC